jgi:addiction module HigA family antidote
MKPLGITITEAAKGLGISRKTLSEIVNGRAALTPKMAVRIGKATSTSPQSWLAMQTKLDLSPIPSCPEHSLECVRQYISATFQKGEPACRSREF